MKNDLNISKLAIICVLCTAMTGAYGASSVRSLGGSNTYTSASNAAAANSASGSSTSSVRGGSVRVTPNSGVSGTSTTINSGSSTTTSGRVATTPRLSIGQYLGGATSVSGGSSLRPQTPSGGSSSGGSSNPDISAELRNDIDQLQRDVIDLRTENENISDQLLDKQDTLIPGQDGYVIIDDNTNEIFVDVEALQESLEGVIGQDGREIELGSNDTDLLWRYVGDGDNWNVLISKAEITGPQGPQGEPGAAADLTNYSTTEEMNFAIANAISAVANTYLTKEEAEATYTTTDYVERGLQGRESTGNKVKAITAENQNSAVAFPTVGAITQWTNEQLQNLSTDGLPVNPDNILDNSISGSKLENGAVTTDKIADEAITEGKLSPELSAEISGKEDKSNKTDTIDGSSTSEQYPSASAVYTALGTKADASAIETINQNVTQVTEQVTQLGDVINNEETGLASQIEDAMLAAGGAQLTAEDAQKAAEAAQDTADSAVAGLAGKQDALGYTAENAANKTTKITSDNQSSPTAYPSVGAIVEWTNQEITKLSDTGLPVNPDNILDNSISGSKLENGAVTTDKIADGAVTTEKLGEDVVTTIDGKADASDVYTKTETNEKIVTLAVPQPDEDCKAESGLCVLSVGTDGQFKWVNVTEPAQ